MRPASRPRASAPETGRSSAIAMAAISAATGSMRARASK
jgi:hypothetical protein